MNPLNKEKLLYLDGIRGIASLLVVVGHFRHYFLNEKINSQLFVFLWSRLNYFFLNGAFCVIVFFTLSGFVLMYNLLNNPTFLSKQIFKRIYRLGLPVIFSVFIYVIVIKFGSVRYFSSEKLMTYDFFDTIYRLFKFLIVSDFKIISFNSSLWTIPIEIVWSYFLFFIFYINLILKSIILKIISLCFLFVLIFYFEIIGYQFAILFLFGSVLAIFKNFIIDFFNNRIKKIVYIVVLLILIYVYERFHLSIDIYLLNFSFIISPMFIVLVMVVGKVQQIFEHPFVLWLGRISFSFYLLHILVLASISNYLFDNIIFFQTNFGLILLMLISVSFSLILSHLFTIFLDEPLMYLFDKNYKKIKSYLNDYKF